MSSSLDGTADCSTPIGDTKYLVAPFEEEVPVACCECMSCNLSHRYKYVLPWFCIGGFVLPLFWFANLFVYISVQWVPNHEPRCCHLEQYEPPTRYEATADFRRRYFEVDSKTVEYIEQVNGAQDTASEIDYGDSEGSVECINFTQEGGPSISDKTLHLTQVAAETLKEHDYMRTLYKRWTGLAVLGTTLYAIAIPLIAKVSMHR
ncbi:hypothetical protein HG535_0E05330 [Zygotorulaspora mrakii]|uniref:Uncharacterized protein n=1 Tax=Zygotorulaspora mrakii TaxID=42260 RepID=A0A7H9B641_ZYGMR|nr:uncharacterized protein HG535_0E05330 [Zygotorulaspora mrakii]QLG73449.1 hypothetical protein HG535_0E05330 [Zygotorulaspora mrakii]